MAYKTVLFNKAFDRGSFECVKPVMAQYLQRQARQDFERKICVVYILENPEKANSIAGYYTLSNDRIPYDQVPDHLSKQLPRYEFLPATLLGRLAVDKSLMGKGYGEDLLLDALRRSFEISTTASGSVAVVTDPLDQDAIDFYTKYSFLHLPGQNRMFLTMKSIAKLWL